MTDKMSEEDRKQLVEYRFERAKQTLADASILCENGSYISAANRIYYASFYAVEALFLHANLHPTTHAGVKRMLGLHFISTGLLDMKWGKWFSDICNMREAGDYDDFVYYQKEDVAPILPEVNEFIQMLQTYVQNH